MKTFLIKVQVHCPAPREVTERIKATTYPVAIKRAVTKVLKENFKGKRPHAIGVAATRL